jgi:hypothetical protein
MKSERPVAIPAYRTTIRIVMITIGALSVAVGCSRTDSGPETGTVYGVVTLDGEPVEAGEVSLFSSATSNGAVASLGSGGAFTVDGPLPVSTYEVTIKGIEPTPDASAADKNSPEVF